MEAVPSSHSHRVGQWRQGGGESINCLQGALSYIHLFYKYSLSIYYVPASGVGTEKTVRNKIRTHTCSLSYPLAGKVLPPDGQIFQGGFCTSGFG